MSPARGNPASQTPTDWNTAIMAAGTAELTGLDFEQGVPLSSVLDGELLLGHAGGEPVLLTRSGGELFAIGASCSHYGAPLAEGLLVDGTLRCPAHHAAFSIRTGEAVRAPALRPIPCWTVEQRDEWVFVTGRRERSGAPRQLRAGGVPSHPESVVIVGAGAAGSAAAEMLRREGYAGPVTLLSADDSPPYDRPNLSKDYLAGNAPEEWIPLRPREFYAENGIELVLGARVGKIDVAGRQVRALGGRAYPYGALLLATGSDPIRLPVPTHNLRHVHYLRTLADSRAIVARSAEARRAVVVGASFIGLEVAASLRARGIEVHLVAPAGRPLENVLGPQVGDFLRTLHEDHGVVFHLGEAVAAIDARAVTLKSGKSIPAEMVVAGIGVRPGIALASWAGLALDKGSVAVDEYLATSAPGIYAAGDLTAWPDPRTGERIRSEHWVVAQRQGQTAARNLLGARERFDAVPFFWSSHYDLTISYAGHAERWDRIDLSGSLAAGDCTLAFRAPAPGGGERTYAVATVGRDRDSLRAEAAMERLDWAALDALVPAAAEAQHA